MTNQEVIEHVETLEKMTPKKAVDLIKTVFLINKTPESECAGTCMYSREYNGIGCAIGAITPSRIKEALTEGQVIGDLILKDSSLAQYFGLDHVDFYADLQAWHDSDCGNPHSFWLLVHDYSYLMEK